MNLAELLKPWTNKELPDCEIVGLHNDSRQIKPGFLFLAYPGTASDGREFITQALNAGASALVYDPENWPKENLPAQLPQLALPRLSTKLAEIASRFYHHPSKKLSVTGVTGTNGKTTIAYQLSQAYNLLKQFSVYIGTLGHGEVNHLKPLANTTPDALCLQQLMYEYQQKRVEHVCMEVSSHALCQQRVEAIDFQQAIFTNLSHEHLDYHQDMEAYAAAKALLFAKPLQWAIINHDDPYYQFMRERCKAEQIIDYGIKKAAQCRALNWDISLKGTQIELESPWGRSELSINALGFFNIYNTLAVFASLLASGYSTEQIIPVMSQLKAAPGRMEIVSQEPYAIVDYAHSPDALDNVLATLKPLKKGRIISVFGCGGDRDKTKRPLMGKVASKYSDLVIITSDNPRNEDPFAIIDAIEAGMDSQTIRYKIENREQAIAKAIHLANKDDIILVAGKGHEVYQQIGNVRHSFSDQAVIRRLIQQ